LDFSSAGSSSENEEEESDKAGQNAELGVENSLQKAWTSTFRSP
jgi:hypothetical protein